MKNDIVVAIRTKRRLRIWYGPGERLIEPHALGYSTDRNLLLRAFQVEGASASGEHDDWKLFRVDRIKSEAPTNLYFDEPRPDYRRDEKAMKGGIIAQV